MLDECDLPYLLISITWTEKGYQKNYYSAEKIRTRIVFNAEYVLHMLIFAV